MTKRKKSGLFYLAAAVFLFIASYYTAKSGDIVFVVMTALAGALFLIAGVMQFKYAKEAAIKAEQNRKTSKINNNKKNTKKRK